MFIVVLSVVLGLIHLYLWKRLVKDTTGPGRVRWLLTAVLAGVIFLLTEVAKAVTRARTRTETTVRQPVGP